MFYIVEFFAIVQGRRGIDCNAVAGAIHNILWRELRNEFSITFWAFLRLRNGNYELYEDYRLVSASVGTGTDDGLLQFALGVGDFIEPLRHLRVRYTDRSNSVHEFKSTVPLVRNAWTLISLVLMTLPPLNLQDWRSTQVRRDQKTRRHSRLLKTHS